MFRDLALLEIKDIFEKGDYFIDDQVLEELEENHILKTDLKLDSLDTTELGLALEDKFKINIPKLEVDDSTTIGEIIDFLYEKLYE